VHSIYRFLLGSPVRRVVVVNGERPTGVISRGTLLRTFGNWSLERAMGRVQAAKQETNNSRETSLEADLASQVQQLASEVHNSVSATAAAQEAHVAG
jgi:hypothetical protein